MRFICLSVLMLFVAVGNSFGQILVDGSAPIGNQASLDTTPSGIPLVNIADPNSSGVSHNQFSEFNVGREGVVINNSLTVGQSQLDGFLLNNPNLNNTASLIINEVTGTNVSNLEGTTEIFGTQADYVLANPNGIICNGCSFFNVGRATLTTGTPQLDASGNLVNISVGRGKITLNDTFDISEDFGLDFTNFSRFDLLSRSVEILAQIHANDLEIIAGRNDVSYPGNIATAKLDDGSQKPFIAIDSSLLGGMYAGMIRLIVTEDGPGVRLRGDTTSNLDDFTILANGDVEYNGIGSAGEINISTTGSVTQNVRSEASSDLNITSDGDVNLAGTSEVQGNSNITSNQGSINQSSQMVASNVTLQAQDNININNNIVATNNLTVSSTNGAANFDNVTLSGEVNVNARSVNFSGNNQVVSNLAATATEDIIFASGSDYTSNANLSVQSLQGDVSLNGSAMIDGTLDIVAEEEIAFGASSDVTVIGDVSVVSNQGNITLAGNLGANGNLITTADNGAISISGTNVTASDLITRALNSVNLAGEINLASNFSVNSGGDIIFASGSVVNVGGYVDVDSTQGAVDINGRVESGGDLDVNVLGSITFADSSNVIALGSVSLASDQGDIELSGNIETGGTLDIEADNGSIGLSGTSTVAVDLATRALNTISLSGSTTVERNLSANSGGNITFTSSSDTTIDGDISLISDQGDIKIGGTIEGSGSLSAMADNGSISFSGVSTLANDLITEAENSFVRFNSGSSVRLGGSLTVSANWLNNHGNVNSMFTSVTTQGVSFASGSFFGSSCGGDIILNSNIFTNDASSSIIADGNLVITAQQVDNLGVLQANDSLTITVDTNGSGNFDLTNDGVIYAQNNINLYVHDSLLNRSGAIYAEDGNLVIARNALLEKNTLIRNSSGLLESGADLSVYTEELINERTNVEIINDRVVDSEFFPFLDKTTLDLPPLPPTNANFDFIVASPSAILVSGLYISGFAGIIGGVNVTEIISSLGTNSTAPGSIRSGGNMLLEATSITNSSSNITSIGTMAINSTSLRNIGIVGERAVTITCQHPEFCRVYDFVNRVYRSATDGRGIGEPRTRTYILGNETIANGSITAGGAISGNSSLVDNISIRENVAIDTITADANPPGSLDNPNAPVVGLGDLVNAAVATSDSGGGLGNNNMGSNISVDDILDNVSSGALFTQSTPGSSTLINSRVGLDMTQFFNSDYLFSRIGFSPDPSVRFLGDAFFENKLILEQIINATGSRFLSNAVNNDIDQVKDLLDNGVAAYSSLNLTVGVALTASQIASLQDDIVWYVEVEIAGEQVLMPVLYLSDSSKLYAAHGAIISGDSVDINTDGLTNSGFIRTDTGTLQLAVINDIVNTGGVIESAGDVDLSADDITNSTVTRVESSSGNIISYEQQKGVISGAGDVTITASGDVANIGSNIISGGATNISGNSFSSTTQAVSNQYSWSSSEQEESRSNTSNLTSKINSGGLLTIDTVSDIVLIATNITAGGSVDIDSGGDVTLGAAADRGSYNLDINSGNSSLDHTSSHVTNRLTQIDSVGNIDISSVGDSAFSGAKLDSGVDINISSGGDLSLGSVKDSSFESTEKSSSNLLWQKQSGKGHNKEEIEHTELAAVGDVNISAAGSISVDYENLGSLEESIAILSQRPGLEYLADLQNDPNVDFTAINKIFKEWDYESEGLTAASGAILAIAITVATAGAGSALGASVGLAAGSASIGAGAAVPLAGTVYTSVSAATAAAFSALVSHAGVSLVNNQGNIGDVLGELSSSDSVRSILVSTVTAGATAGVSSGLNINFGGLESVSDLTNASALGDAALNVGINSTISAGVDSAISGDNFTENLVDALRSATASQIGAALSYGIGQAYKVGEIDKARQLIAHAAVGCASGALSNDACVGGAIGAFAGEAGADLAHSAGQSAQASALFGRYAALATALVSGVDAEGAVAANASAQNAINNNFLMPKEKLSLHEELQECADASCKQAVQEKYEKISKPRDKAFDDAYEACKDDNRCQNFFSIHYDLRNRLTEEGNEYYNKNKGEFVKLPPSEAIFHTFERDANTGDVINIITGSLEGYSKYIHPILGYEVVLDDNKKIVTDPLNIGTYNFYNPTVKGVDNSLLADNVLHADYDVYPYFRYGNSSLDPTQKWERWLRSANRVFTSE